jgi:hypothetical protein
MENVKLEATGLNPEVELDLNGTIRISGKSMMEDASRYYQPIHDWIDEYIKNELASLTFEISLTYFNSSSAKQLLKVLMTVDEAEFGGSVVWMYPASNDLLKERGEELEIMLDLPFVYRAK